MALEQRYSAIGDEGSIAGTVHTQINCPAFKSGSDIQLVGIEWEGNTLQAEYRGITRNVNECDRCQPELEWHWQADANCHKTYLNMIDPLDPDHLIEEYCTSCPVQLECGEFGLSRKMFGIWGGVYLPQKAKDRGDAFTRLKGVCAMLRRSDARSRVA